MAKLYVSNKDESARLFKSDRVEMLTHVHWSVPVIVYAPVVTYMLWRSAQLHVPTSTTAFLFFAGVLFWTFTEYMLHRFVFHYEPRTAIGKQIHFYAHGVHHDYPNDSKRLVMPPSISLPMAIPFYYAFISVLGDAHTAGMFAGFMFGYVCYDEIHYATHHAPMKKGIGRWLKHHHVLHHYHTPERGFGVSSPLWDVVFGTLEDVKRTPMMTE